MTDEILKRKQVEIDRLIAICVKNNWPRPRTSGALIRTHEMANKIISNLNRTVTERSDGKRMREDGTYF